MVRRTASSLEPYTNYALHIFYEDQDLNDGVRKLDKEPTGLLVDSAMKLVTSHIPDDSVNDRREARIFGALSMRGGQFKGVLDLDLGS
ncbi:hypothetical protein RIF29_41284 [Crotalaria pallida]|uniref:Uncharacterized protein n=1 Tax=Crotalaria pallida TaxID=3830 RepID=A0AAN9E641_CROPI